MFSVFAYCFVSFFLYMYLSSLHSSSFYY